MKELSTMSYGSIIHKKIIINFKMKYEITVEHYMNCGLGWHGMVITFNLYDHMEDVPYKNIVYLDQKASSYHNHLIIFMIRIYNQKLYQKLFISSIAHSNGYYG